MAEITNHKHPGQKRYPPELRERAVRMVLETIEQTGERFGVVNRIARQLGIGPESLRSWVRQAEIVGGQRPGTSTQDKARIAALEREVRELRRANEILRTAAAFFSFNAWMRLVRRGSLVSSLPQSVAGGLSGDVRPRRAVRPGSRRGLRGACLVPRGVPALPGRMGPWSVESREMP